MHQARQAIKMTCYDTYRAGQDRRTLKDISAVSLVEAGSRP